MTVQRFVLNVNDGIQDWRRMGKKIEICLSAVHIILFFILCSFRNMIVQNLFVCKKKKTQIASLNFLEPTTKFLKVVIG